MMHNSMTSLHMPCFCSHNMFCAVQLKEFVGPVAIYGDVNDILEASMGKMKVGSHNLLFILCCVMASSKVEVLLCIPCSTRDNRIVLCHGML